MIWIYIIIAVILVALELIYFKIADKCNIIDKSNERSRHSTIVLRGGGIIFPLSMLVWCCLQGAFGDRGGRYIEWGVCGVYEDVLLFA